MAVEGISAPAVHKGFFEKAGASIDRLNTRIWEAASSIGSGPYHFTADKVSRAAHWTMENRGKVACGLALGIATAVGVSYVVNLRSTYIHNAASVQEYQRKVGNSACSQLNFFQTGRIFKCVRHQDDLVMRTEGEECLNSLSEELKQSLLGSSLLRCHPL